MPRYKNVNGATIQLTAEEEAIRELDALYEMRGELVLLLMFVKNEIGYWQRPTIWLSAMLQCLMLGKRTDRTYETYQHSLVFLIALRIQLSQVKYIRSKL